MLKETPPAKAHLEELYRAFPKITELAQFSKEFFRIVRNCDAARGLSVSNLPGIPPSVALPQARTMRYSLVSRNIIGLIPGCKYRD